MDWPIEDQCLIVGEGFMALAKNISSTAHRLRRQQGGLQSGSQLVSKMHLLQRLTCLGITPCLNALPSAGRSLTVKRILAVVDAFQCKSYYSRDRMNQVHTGLRTSTSERRLLGDIQSQLCFMESWLSYKFKASEKGLRSRCHLRSFLRTMAITAKATKGSLRGVGFTTSNYWKLCFRIAGCVLFRSNIICPNRPLAHENLYR